MNVAYNTALRQSKAIRSELSALDSRPGHLITPAEIGNVSASLSSFTKALDDYQGLARQEIVPKKQEEAFTRVKRFREELSQLRGQLDALKRARDDAQNSQNRSELLGRRPYNATPENPYASAHTTTATTATSSASTSTAGTTTHSTFQPRHHASASTSGAAGGGGFGGGGGGGGGASGGAFGAGLGGPSSSHYGYGGGAGAAAAAAAGGPLTTGSGDHAREAHAFREQSFFANTNQALDDYIARGQAVLGDLGQQREMLKSTQKRLYSVGTTLGISGDTIRMVERRAREDKWIFVAGVLVFFLFCWLVLHFLR